MQISIKSLNDSNPISTHLHCKLSDAMRSNSPMTLKFQLSFTRNIWSFSIEIDLIFLFSFPWNRLRRFSTTFTFWCSRLSSWRWISSWKWLKAPLPTFSFCINCKYLILFVSVIVHWWNVRLVVAGRTKRRVKGTKKAFDFQVVEWNMARKRLRAINHTKNDDERRKFAVPVSSCGIFFAFISKFFLLFMIY